LLAAAQHLTGKFRLGEMMIHEACLRIDGGNRNDGMLHGKAGDELDGGAAKGRAVVAMQFASCHVDRIAIDGRQRAGNVRRVGDDGECGFLQQFAGQKAGRRAGIQHDAVTILDDGRQMGRKPPFGLGVFAHAALERRFACLQRGPHGAVHLDEVAGPRQRCHVAPDGFARYAELGGQFRNAQAAAQTKLLNDLFLPG